MAEYIRYDLYKDGFKHSHGMLSHCSETNVYYVGEEMGREASEIMRYFCDSLPIPPYYNFNHHSRGYDRAYFTPEGYEIFGAYAERLAELINEAGGGWEARKVVVEADVIERNHEVFYRDGYQVVAGIDYYRREEVSNA